MHVSVLTVIQFVVVIAYLELFVLTLYKNHRERLNQVFALFTLCFLWWGVDMLLIWMPDTSQQTAILADKIGSLGWIPFSSFFLWFALVFTKKTEILKMKAFYAVILSIPLVLIVRQLVAPFSLCLKRGAYGWNFAWDGSVWSYAYLTYYFAFFFIGLWLIAGYYRRADDEQRKMQALIILISTLVSAAIGTVTDIALPLLMGQPMPSLGDIAVIIWVGGIFYAIVRYKLLGISFERASQNIIDHMANSLLLLNQDGKVIDINKRAAKFLNYTKEEMVNREAAGYFGPEHQAIVAEMVRNRTEIENLDARIIIKGAATVPVLLSCSRVTNETGQFLGWVCMASDISRQKQAEAALAEKNAELNKNISELERFQKLIVNRELKMMELKKQIQALGGTTLPEA